MGRPSKKDLELVKLFDDGRTPSMAKANLDYEEIEDYIKGCSPVDAGVRALGKRYGVHYVMMHQFLNLPKYKARTEQMVEAKGDAWAELSYSELCVPVNNNWEANMQKEKSQRCLFFAKVCNRQKYGDKVDVTKVTIELSADQRKEKLKMLEERISKK